MEHFNDLFELKPKPITTVEKSNNSSYTSEKTINIISYVFLVLGIILSFIGLITFLDEADKYNPDFADYFLSLSMFFVGFICIIVWAILKALSNISTTLKQINDKIK